MKKGLFIIVLSGLFLLLVASILQMPSLGSIENPSYNETAVYYLENAVEDTHAPNAIAAIITDYRAFDTLGETTVLFTSIAAVISVLKISHHSKNKGDKANG
ncbi:hydrogen gas-evolving membrane-bound hydrogenase subunit E [Alkaliphilus peptidifermentans]|uniref:Multicomponent Na+:H+ antiporter subunit B n=1 Tax=Alkaliphilus peptidifermentans DSM 18978 TaxID=1120976 RepID=A0A1G5GG85_9FIRM|nr:hydrogen gas-evolving membrane-bound hydrogenase subunit E [Alkaliphilus peptidifermentans]SCY49718.1 multicomponent Na+:H+ antiporter subunit B [Alkaliphilus peptidifermentans DSM 18978]